MKSQSSSKGFGISSIFLLKSPSHRISHWAECNRTSTHPYCSIMSPFSSWSVAKKVLVAVLRGILQHIMFLYYHHNAIIPTVSINLRSSNSWMHPECAHLRANFIQFHHILYIILPRSHFTMCLHMLAPFAKPSTTVLAASANSRINFWPSSLALGNTLGSQSSWKCCRRHSQQSSLTMCSYFWLYVKLLSRCGMMNL